MSLEIITPPAASLPLDHILVAITEEIDKHDPGKVAHGVLGGSHGYGAHWDSSVFMMHPYCWCEMPQCLWCGIWLSNETQCTEEEARAHRNKQTAEALALYGPWIGSVGYLAPHFWHKPSGFQVRWYKWIGRSMLASGPQPDLGHLLKDCLADVRAQASALKSRHSPPSNPQR